MALRSATPKLQELAMAEGYEGEAGVLELVQEALASEGWTMEDMRRGTVAAEEVTDSRLLEVARSSAWIPYEELIEPYGDLGAAERARAMLEETPEACSFSEREKKVFESWIAGRIRNNTSWMVGFLRLALVSAEDRWMSANGYDFTPPTLDSRRFLATVLFTDAFNRADEIFDEVRDHFVDNGHVEMSPMSLPIIAVEGEDPATLEEAIRVFWKIVQSSDEYTGAERIFLEGEFLDFYRTTTSAMKKYEHLEEYTLDDAVQLRSLTLYPLATFMTHVLHTSRLVEHDDDALYYHGLEVAEAVSKLSLITQIRDDFLDLNRDVEGKNMNLVYGAMQDAGEVDEDVGGSRETFDYYYFDEDYPETTRMLEELRDQLVEYLPDEYQDMAYKFDMLA